MALHGLSFGGTSMLTQYSPISVPFNEGRSNHSSTFALAALTAALEIACDAAVFSDRFEIDEQEPLSRIQALTEQLVESVNSLPCQGLPQDEVAGVKTFALAIIDKVCEHIHASIR
jgi:hypothetical protein